MLSFPFKAKCLAIMTSSLHFYYHPTPNPSKVALFLEETGLPYELHPIDIARGEQHSPHFEALNPNRKVPVVVDGDIAIFDSSAILLHLARRSGRFLGDTSDRGQAELLSWLMFIASGVGPFTGQAIHFKYYAPQPQPYASHRYAFEAERHWMVLEQRLAGRAYLTGDTYTVVDMAFWGWARGLHYLTGDLAWERFPNVAKLFREIDARPAAERVRQLATRHDFKRGTDEETLASLFRHGISLS